MIKRRRAIAVANGKGGVGKTTITANLAACWAAHTTWRILAVDLDAQGNLATAFGLDDEAAPPEPPATIPTGRDRLAYAAWSLPAGGPEAAQALSDALAETDCHLALIDTPPSAAANAADAALAAARWLLIPARCDRHSIDGIATLLERALVAGDGRIEPLGIVLFAINRRATAIVRDTRADLAERLAGAIDVLDNTIRFAERAHVDALDAGRTAGELAAIARHQKPWYQDPDTLQFAANTDALAYDYDELAEELGGRLAASAKRRLLRKAPR